MWQDCLENCRGETCHQHQHHHRRRRRRHCCPEAAAIQPAIITAIQQGKSRWKDEGGTEKRVQYQ